MKKVYLVQHEPYSTPFMAFESHSDAFDYARAYCESLPSSGTDDARKPWDMVKEAFLTPDGGDGIDEELDRIGRETEAYWGGIHG